jgi:TIR domain
MAKIAVSYRRSDTKWITGRIVEHLENHFGAGNVFMDIDNIPLGVDFRDHIREVLVQCDVLIVLVGPKWQEIDRSGNRWTVEGFDWVRFEIRTALERKIPVVPLLIDGTKMPKVSELPDDLRDFAFRQAATFDTEDFKHQIQRLIKSLDRLIADTMNKLPLSNLLSTEKLIENYTPPNWLKDILDKLEKKQQQPDKAKPVSSFDPISNSLFLEFSEKKQQPDKAQNAPLNWKELLEKKPDKAKPISSFDPISNSLFLEFPEKKQQPDKAQNAPLNWKELLENLEKKPDKAKPVGSFDPISNPLNLEFLKKKDQPDKAQSGTSSNPTSNSLTLEEILKMIQLPDKAKPVHPFDPLSDAMNHLKKKP